MSLHRLSKSNNLVFIRPPIRKLLIIRSPLIEMFLYLGQLQMAATVPAIGKLTLASFRSARTSKPIIFPYKVDVFSFPIQLYPRCGLGPGGFAILAFVSLGSAKKRLLWNEALSILSSNLVGSYYTRIHTKRKRLATTSSDTPWFDNRTAPWAERLASSSCVWSLRSDGEPLENLDASSRGILMVLIFWLDEGNMRVVDV